MKPVPVVFYSPNQRYLYDRLFKHCLDLDGTKILKINGPEPTVGYPAVTNVAFKTVCKAMKGTPFIWLEADSIPTKKGWLKALQDEWEVAQSFGKEIVWTTDVNPPHDLCTGIGIYGPNAVDLVPDNLSNDGFDGFIMKRHATKIHRTPLIEHRYGVYDARGDVTHNRNPKVRKNSVIFHKDQFQDLISREKHFGSSGDLGDIIYMLPIMREAGGGYLWLYDRPFTKTISNRFDVIAPLLASQPYIKATSLSNGKGVQYDLSMFRSFHKATQTLLDSQSAYAHKTYGLKRLHKVEPWLTAKPLRDAKGRVIISRSPRYHNPMFPWKEIVKFYGKRCLFVGMKDEHQDFTKKFGEVEFRSTRNLLDLAELIAGADLFIGNQSSPMAVAIGLGVPFIQETCAWQPDCVFERENGQYCVEGICTLPSVAESGELRIGDASKINKPSNTNLVPPGGWQYPSLPVCNHFSVQSKIVARKEKCDTDEAAQKLFDHNVKRIPSFFEGRKSNTSGLFKIALQNAKEQQPK